MISGILFCVCIVAANFFETKIIRMGPVSITAGLLVFPLSYIINDCISEVWGFRKARLVIWLGFLMNFLTILLSRLAIALPAAPSWKGGPAFDFVFGLAPRIALASLAAFLAGSFLNAYVLSRMKVRSRGRHFSVRAIVSTLVGEGADSLLFFPLAFGGLVPVGELCRLMGVQIVLKTLYEILILPLTARVITWIKRREGTDAYDDDISYNILKINEL